MLFRSREVAEEKPDARFVIDAGGKVVGRCGLFDFDEYARTCRLGIGIGDREYWGRGYGRECVGLLLEYAFRHRNIHKVCLDVLADNERAISSYVACGFIEEGRLRQQEWHQGEFKDTIVMGILREEWERAQAPDPA